MRVLYIRLNGFIYLTSREKTAYTRFMEFLPNRQVELYEYVWCIIAELLDT